jgi:hypothetical protein
VAQEFKFYYDESEHSRKITPSTVVADNYYDNFVTVTVGWDKSDEQLIEKRYTDFESKYSIRKSKGELKSTTLNPKQFENGFASLKKENINFIGDFLCLFDEKVFLYFSVTSKIEYIVNQLFVNYQNNLFEDMDAMKYSIVKSILQYRPQEIIKGMYENTGELVQLLKNFYSKKIEENRANLELKKLENKAFLEILSL